METALIWTMVAGSLRDPILWVLAAVVGWDHARAAAKTFGFLVTAGCLWGAIRVAIYMTMAHDEPLGLSLAAQIMLICVLLMAAVGMAVREGRWLIAKR